MKQHELFSYIYDFISQLWENKLLFDSIEKIILFGSIARGDFREESDVDLFIDLRSPEKLKEINHLIKKEINKFETRCEKTWFLRGIKLPLKVIAGNLEQERWKELKEEILSYGKIIYGKFEERPRGLAHQVLISYTLKNLSQMRKMAFLRKLFGYTSRKRSKKYIRKGLIDEVKGERVGSQALLLGVEELIKIKKILKEYKVKYQLRDIWLR